MDDRTRTIGFIGQGFIGKHYADDFEARGFRVVRYALEEPYLGNREAIKTCGVVFIAVPTPTTRGCFDDSIVRSALNETAPGTIVVIKSTLLPGTTEALQKTLPDRIILHSPEFLRESSAAHDAAHPDRTIIGVPEDTEAHRSAAEVVRTLLPRAPYELVCSSREAEYIKYAGNVFLFWKVLFANICYDAVTAEGADWEVVREALGADPRIGPSHLGVLHASGHPGASSGRGAGGHCLIKDFAAFTEHYKLMCASDTAGQALLGALERKNIELLRTSGKDIELLDQVYGTVPQSV